jgi:hypothetical protein
MIGNDSSRRLDLDSRSNCPEIFQSVGGREDEFLTGVAVHQGCFAVSSIQEAGVFPVPKVCQYRIFFVPLGLALSEKQIPQITENTEK